MKILMTSRNYPKPGGGISGYVYELSRRLQRKHKVHFCTYMLKTNPQIIESGAFFLQSSLRSRFKDYDIYHTQGDEGLWTGVVTAHSIHAGAINLMQKRNLDSWIGISWQ